jgi:hypothetical protein
MLMLKMDAQFLRITPTSPQISSLRQIVDYRLKAGNETQRKCRPVQRLSH